MRPMTPSAMTVVRTVALTVETISPVVRIVMTMVSTTTMDLPEFADH